ncbi:hypothetical protein MMC21_006946, partial [Puttea exsequens]|nr:hypothetical protein [Puttea exsequens]
LLRKATGRVPIPTMQALHWPRYPRELVDTRDSNFERLVTASDSLNESKWRGFMGLNNTVNSLLNKPLSRRGLASAKLQEPFHAVDFSSRRSLLGTLVYLNPDCKEGRTACMNPILVPGKERSSWEGALLNYIETGEAGEKASGEYWWKFTEEG